MSKQTYSVCFCFRRRFKLAVAEAPEEIKILYGKYSENGIMTVHHLHRFMVEVQKEDKATVEVAQATVDSLSELRHLHIHHRKGLTLEAFFKYLFGDINSPLSPNLGVHHDMNAPLSHYFIYTSHNSYLTGNQLSSDCSDVPIVDALKKGVRVIELDMWPNSSKDNVDVLHGKTLTTPVELLRCLRSIHEYAFVASDYPVILTLEDHLTPDLQAKVARMITQTFGDLLFYPGSVCYNEFPSPELLKRRILVSTKPPKEYMELKETKGKESEVPKSKVSDEDGSWGKEVSIREADAGAETKSRFDEEDNDQEEDFDVEDKSQRNAAPEYKELIAIQAKKRRGGFDDYLKMETEVKRLSLNEQKFQKATTTHGKQIVRYTQRNLLRIFPKAMRFDSSNYRPDMGWIHGAQMVALNMQGHGTALWLMQGLFRANGGCGYVKKPDFLLKSDPDDEIFDPKAKLPVKTTLKVTIYMGDGWYYDFRQTHFDAYSPPDFYVRVGIAGVPVDSAMKRTKTLEDNWIPAWNETFEFPLTVPELALLRIVVHEYDMSEKDDFAGQTCLPIWELRQGIRAVPLHDHQGEKYRSVKLLMRFDFI